jgi:hypothetical protein
MSELLLNLRPFFRFGVLLTQNKVRKISSLDSLNAIQEETDIGFSLQKCKIVGSVFICPTNIFFEKNLAANACLKDIFLKIRLQVANLLIFILTVNVQSVRFFPSFFQIG